MKRTAIIVGLAAAALALPAAASAHQLRLVPMAASATALSDHAQGRYHHLLVNTNADPRIVRWPGRVVNVNADPRIVRRLGRVVNANADPRIVRHPGLSER